MFRRGVKGINQARWLTAKPLAQRVFTSEDENLLKQVNKLICCDDAEGHENGALRIGRQFCKSFDIEIIKGREISSKYMKIMREHAPELLEHARVVGHERRLSTPFVESSYSSFKVTPQLEARNSELYKKLQNYLIVDFETTTVEKHKRKASPFTNENRVVYTAYEYANEKAVVEGPFSDRTGYQKSFPCLKNVDVLVGHNIKFDLLYIWDFPKLKEFFLKGGLIWDTMYAEYLIEGHSDGVRLRLDDLSLTYGGTQKDDFIKQQWKKGIDTADIDQATMVEYAMNDAINTRIIYENQIGILNISNRLPMVISHTEGLLATTEMEYNGLFVDNEVTNTLNSGYISKIEKAEKELAALHTPKEVVSFNKKHMDKMVGEPAEFNWGSVAQLRALLYGGVVKYSTTVEGEPTKAGKARTKRIQEEVSFEGIVPKTWMQENEYTYASDGVWTVTDRIIEALGDSFETEVWAQAISILRTIKKLKKLSVYLNNFEALQDKNKLIHPSLNHTVTRTGRLSAANPNMQNIPRGKGVKECLTTRFKGGCMLESDYSQLEVFVLALLSQDINLGAELSTGTDLHCKRLARIRDLPYDKVLDLCKVQKLPEWEEARTKAKIFQFQVCNFFFFFFF